MATELWTRGKVIPAKGFKFRRDDVASPGTWYSYTYGSTGRSELVSSERDWPRRPYSNVEDFYYARGRFGHKLWRDLSREEKSVVKAAHRRYKNALPKPNNAFYRTFNGTVRSDRSEIHNLQMSTAWPKGSTMYLNGQIAEVLSNQTKSTLPLPVVPSSARSIVESGLYVNATQPRFDGYTQLGELKETVAMLRSPLLTLREASQMLYDVFRKRTRKLKGKDLQEAIGGTWLEYSFGVSPLIFGTAGIVSSLVDAFGPTNPRVETVRKTLKDDLEPSTTRAEHLILYYLGCQYSRTVDIGWEVRGGLRLKPQASRLTPAAVLGLDSMRGIVSQAWALLPLSFVVDWFVGVGPLLDSCRPLNNRVIDGYVTTSRWHRDTVNLLRVYSSSTTQPQSIDGVCERLNWSTERSTNVSNPGILHLGPGLFSLSQGISLAALAAGPITTLWSKRPWH